MPFLIKSDPETYGWDELVKEGKTEWTGVRAYAARNHLRNMKLDDLVLFYHSGAVSSVVGIARVTKEFFQDPSSDDEAWVAVEVAPVKKLKREVSLAEIKMVRALRNMLLLKISRLSAMPVTQEEFDLIVGMAGKE